METESCTEAVRIRNQLDRAFAGQAWHGTPVFEVLAGISTADASLRPIKGSHSIWEIVNHIEAWLSIVRKRAGGENVGEITIDVDWPPMPEDLSKESWRGSVESLKAAYLSLVDFIDTLSDDDLGTVIRGKLRNYTVYEELHGVIQHSLYHLGQIVILAKAAESS